LQTNYAIKEERHNIRSMFFGLENTLNRKHPMYILTNKENLQLFEESFAPLYCLDNGCPAKPIRLMIGLLILKHLRNISDESAIEQLWPQKRIVQIYNT